MLRQFILLLLPSLTGDTVQVIYRFGTVTTPMFASTTYHSNGFSGFKINGIQQMFDNTAYPCMLPPPTEQDKHTLTPPFPTPLTGEGVHHPASPHASMTGQGVPLRCPMTLLTHRVT